MRDDSGVVHEHVQLAEPGVGGFDGALPGGFVGYVEVDVGRLSAGLDDLLRDGLSTFVEQVSEDHGGALGGEHAGLDRSHAFGGAAYEGHFTLQSDGWNSSRSLTVVWGDSSTFGRSGV